MKNIGVSYYKKNLLRGINKLNIGIIGSGSAAARIYKILLTLNKNNKINIYSKRKNFKIGKKILPTKKFNFNSSKNEDYFFVSNNSNEHYKYLINLIKNQKNIYVEKPICTTMEEAKIIKKKLRLFKKKLHVGYQFRENKCINFLKNYISKNRNKIVFVSAYSGENVKKYHKGENYIRSYTVKKKDGGGVLLTQSHQIDYLTYLFGKFKSIKSLSANNNKKFNLKSNVEGNVSYILKTNDDILINCNLNYFAQKKTYLYIKCLDETIFWNNEKNEITLERKNKIKKKFFQTREDMFKKKIKNFLVNKKEKKVDNKIFDIINVITKIKYDFKKKKY